MKKLVLGIMMLILLTACNGGDLEGTWELKPRKQSGCKFGYTFDGENTVTVFARPGGGADSAKWERVGDNRYRFDFGIVFVVYEIKMEDGKLFLKEKKDDDFCTYERKE